MKSAIPLTHDQTPCMEWHFPPLSRDPAEAQAPVVTYDARARLVRLTTPDNTIRINLSAEAARSLAHALVSASLGFEQVSSSEVKTLPPAESTSDRRRTFFRGGKDAIGGGNHAA